MRSGGEDFEAADIRDRGVLHVKQMSYMQPDRSNVISHLRFEDKLVRNFDVDSAVLKWEAALEDLQKGQAALACAMQLYSAREAEYPYQLVAAVLRLRGVHERRYDTAAIALHASKVMADVPQARYVEYALPAPQQSNATKWRPHLPSRESGVTATASTQ